LKKTVSLFFICLLFFTTAACNAQTSEPAVSIEDLIKKSREVNEFYYEVAIGHEPIRILQKTWVKNDKARMETLVMEGNLLLSTQGKIYQEGIGVVDQYAINHHQSGNNAVIGDAIGIGTFEGIREQTFLREVDAIDPSAAKIIKTEQINGYDCAVIDHGETKIWLSKELGVPLKVETGDMTLQYENVKAGPGTVADKDLSKPENVEGSP
jgi:outer membrane lipoprotein-sorting protein